MLNAVFSTTQITRGRKRKKETGIDSHKMIKERRKANRMKEELKKYLKARKSRLNKKNSRN